MDAITPDAKKKQDEITSGIYGLGLFNKASSSIRLRIELQLVLSFMKPFVNRDKIDSEYVTAFIVGILSV
jgi:hypothetical protein